MSQSTFLLLNKECSLDKIKTIAVIKRKSLKLIFEAKLFFGSIKNLFKNEFNSSFIYSLNNSKLHRTDKEHLANVKLSIAICLKNAAQPKHQPIVFVPFFCLQLMTKNQLIFEYSVQVISDIQVPTLIITLCEEVKFIV